MNIAATKLALSLYWLAAGVFSRGEVVLCSAKRSCKIDLLVMLSNSLTFMVVEGQGLITFMTAVQEACIGTFHKIAPGVPCP